MFDTIFGLPVHALVIHAVVVLMPLAAVAVIVAAVWPTFRRWAGPLPLILAVVATALVPVATQSGEALEQARQLGQLEAVRTHQGLGELMLWWGLGLVVAAAAVYWLHWRSKRQPDAAPLGMPVVVAIMVVALAAGVGSLVHVIRVGDSGARAVWGESLSVD